VALADVDAQIKHSVSFSGGTPGAPAAVAGVARPGRPFTRAAKVLFAAAFDHRFRTQSCCQSSASKSQPGAQQPARARTGNLWQTARRPRPPRGGM